MKRTTIYLTEGQKSELERIAAETGRTEADLIREGVDGVVTAHGPPRRKPRAITSKWDPSLQTHEDIENALEGLGEG